MTEEEAIEIEGVVLETLPNAVFRVEMQNGHRILAQVPDETPMHFLKILPGDTVSVALFPSDLAKGRIVYRNKA
jgi:translation initiation factor IF-1